MRIKHLLFLAISAGFLGVNPAWSNPIVNTDNDGVEDVAGGDAYAYYQNSGDFMFLGGDPGSGNYNDEPAYTDGLLESMVEAFLGIADSTTFSLTKATDIFSTNYNDDGEITDLATASGTWSTNSAAVLSFYSVKAANNYAMYLVDLAASTGSWSTYDLWFAGYGGEGALEISHFNGYNVSVAPVPEPATMLLLGTGLAGLVGLRSRRRK
jgi:hypothetical protein